MSHETASQSSHLQSEPRVDRAVWNVSDSFDDRAATNWWHAQTPEARIQHTLFLIKVNYGDRATGRLQRVLEIVE